MNILLGIRPDQIAARWRTYASTPPPRSKRIVGWMLCVVVLSIIASPVTPAPQVPSNVGVLPDAEVKVWHIIPTVGFNPDESVEDIGGLTDQVATAEFPLTICTAMENTTNPGGPCGVVYWNPETNVFRDFGFSGGVQTGIDLNTSAPPKSDQKCINSINKNATKIVKAQGKDICSCIKDGAKGKLTGTIDECITSDPKGKVAKAETKLDEKIAKTS